MPQSSPKIMLESKIPYESPPVDSNVALELLNALRSHDPGRVLLVDSINERQLTCGQLLDKVGRLATGLVSRVGVKPGDVVLIMCDQSDHAIIMALASLMAGAGFMGVYPDCFQDLKHACELLEVNLIATDLRHLGLVDTVRAKVPSTGKAKLLYVNDEIDSISESDRLDHKSNRIALVKELVRDFSFDEDLLNNIVRNVIKPEQHVTVWMLTSGSTGKSKIVPWTHAKQMHDLWCVKSSNKHSPLGASGARPLLPLHKDSVLSGDLPLDQGVGFVTMLWCILEGAKYVILPCYCVDGFWAGVEKYKITSSIASTTFTSKLFARLKQLIDTNQTSTIDISSFEYICCVGIKLAFNELLQQVRRFYTNITTSQFYGTTEIGFISMVPTEECDTNMDSVGYLMPSLKAKIVDLDTGACCGPNEKGELHLWSEKLFMRYVCASVDVDKLFRDCLDDDGFYKTGDLAHYDDQGRIYIHGRIKETLMLMYDWKIMPDELEKIVNNHPLVEKSVVVGVTDEDWPGCQKPRAFVKLVSKDSKAFRDIQAVDKVLADNFLSKDHDLLCKHVTKFVEGEVSEAKQIRGGVRILDEFPTVGRLNKIDRKTLQAMD